MFSLKTKMTSETPNLANMQQISINKFYSKVFKLGASLKKERKPLLFYYKNFN